METTLTTVCRSIRNYFYQHVNNNAVIFQCGKFKIQDGSISPSIELIEGQYYRIVGNIMNNGIYKYGSENFVRDEEFNGYMIPLSIPDDFLDIVADIKAILESKTDNSNVISESFAGYSYQLATDDKGTPLSWQDVFAAKLNPYRRHLVELVDGRFL